MSIQKYCRLFKQADTISDANIALNNILHAHGITTFAFTYYAYHPLSKNKLKYSFSSPHFAVWHKHYVEEGYEAIDTTLAEVYRNCLPVAWDLQEQLQSAKCHKERQMRLDSIEFGTKNGLSIPIHGPNDDFAVLLLIQMKNEEKLVDLESIQDQLMLLAHCYYQTIGNLLLIDTSPANQYCLNDRELQCILLTAQKQSVNDIAQILQIKPRTVHFHLQNANKKLGVPNKYQSVAKAIEKGIIVL